MKRLLILILAIATLGFVLAGCGSEEPKEEVKGVLKIGTMSPLTGPYAADGNDIANGAKAAVAVFMEKEGLPMFSDVKVFSEDTACDPRQAVAAANKLINEEVTAVVGAYCSSSTIPSSEALMEASIFMLTPASTSPKVTERGLKYMYRTCGRDDHQAPAGVKFMKDVLGAKTVYIVDDKTTYSQGLADGVEASAKEMGLTVLGHDHVNQGDKDFSAVITKVKEANPDVFYVSLQNSATGALMVIQAKRAGITAQLMGQDAVYHPQLMEIAKADAEGMFLTFGDIDKSTENYKAFMERYKADYETEPGAYSAYSFDSATAYLMAVKKAGTTDPEKVKVALESLEFDGASKHVKYDSKGDSGSNYTVYKVENGQFVRYWNSLTGEKY